LDKKCKILLIYPGPKAKFPRLPMSCIVLAAYLRQRNFDVEILDTRLDTTEGKRWSDYLCIGISSMSGLQLKYAIGIARIIKSQAPKVPLVWGGAHVSFYPRESAESPLVDYVVRGEGEETLFELIERVILNKCLEEIPGATFYHDEKLFSGSERMHVDMDGLPFPAYDLVSLARYSDSVEGFSYETSRGCPHRCGFCYNDFFHRRDWRAKSAEKIFIELERVRDEYGIKKIYFIDDNFMVSLSRVKKICQKIKDLNLNWASSSRADYLAVYKREDFILFKESGCLYLQYGAESGSAQELDYIQKDITPQDIINSVRNCIEAGIMQVLSFMIGLPNETKVDREKTLNLYDYIMKLDGDIEINGIFIYTPYPGTFLYNEAVKSGFKERIKLEEWGKWKFGDPRNIPWIKRKDIGYLETIEIISIFNYYVHRLNFYSKTYRKKMLGFLGYMFYYLIIPVMRLSASLRWRHRLFFAAPEWRLFKFLVARLFPR